MNTCGTCRHWTPFDREFPGDDRYCALASADPLEQAPCADSRAVAWSVEGNTAYLSTEADFGCNQWAFGSPDRGDDE